MERTELRKEGAPCWLRPPDEGDAAELFEAAAGSRERVSRWMPWLTPDYGLEDSAEWARGARSGWDDGTRYEFVMVDGDSGRLCGCCGLNRINPVDRVCNLGYWVSDAVVRRGYATAAADMLRDFGIGTLGMKRIEIVVADGNDASRGVAEKVGAVYEGLQRMRLRIGEVSHDAHMYALLAE